MKRKKNAIVPLKILRIENDAMHLLLKVKINSRVASLVVDTGASRTVFDKSKIEKYVKQGKIEKHEIMAAGLGTAGMESHVAEINKMEIGKLKIENIQFVLLDLSHVNNSYQQIGMKEIDGVLGGDILMKHNAVIDYGKRKITFHY